MCLVAIAWKTHPRWSLVVAANRDEWRDRPAAPAGWWADAPGVLAGRDLRAGGTWMGVTRDGRFAAVTNFRDPSDKRGDARSRGELVAEFLKGRDDPRRFLDRLAAIAGAYNGFNLRAAHQLTAAQLKAFPTTWAKRLAFGRDPRAVHLSALTR